MPMPKPCNDCTFLGSAVEAAQFLIEERDIVGVGADTLCPAWMSVCQRISLLT